MFNFPVAVRKRRGFHCDAAPLLALGLCGAFAVVWQAGQTRPARPPAAGAERAASVAADAPAKNAARAPAANAAPEVWLRGVRFERLAEIGRGPVYAARRPEVPG